MKRLWWLLAISAIVAQPGTVLQAGYPRRLADWISTNRPQPADDWWAAAEADFHHDWEVGSESGQPIVTLREQTRPPTRLPFEPVDPADKFRFTGTQKAARVADGWVASFNRGEWGGSLWWFAPDGVERYRISQENIEAFVLTGRDLYLLEGVAHGSADQGSLRRLTRLPSGRWASRFVADLHDTPRAATVDGRGSILVVSGSRLTRINPTTRHVEVLILDAFWRSFFPSSIAVDPAGDAWIGMRHGVVRVDQLGTTPRTHWYLPARSGNKAHRIVGFQ